MQELLNHSKMEAGWLKLKRTILIFMSLYLRYKIFNPTFIDKGITFDLKCVNNYVISADRDMLEKRIKNFLTNAIDYVRRKKVYSIDC